MASQPKTALFRAKNQIALVGAECTTCELSPSTQWCLSGHGLPLATLGSCRVFTQCMAQWLPGETLSKVVEVNTVARSYYLYTAQNY